MHGSAMTHVMGGRTGRGNTTKGPLAEGTLRLHGADDEIRTRDPHLGKVMLYQLSHVRMLSY